ncbi:uncharacterized protein METZ01_LOCUS493603 [marine metagenome]|uniref:Uncharacterized protein n=1 Tax=marine metagenome TaxID=408172 RepID=A0A383D8Y6_9ZZZZ
MALRKRLSIHKRKSQDLISYVLQNRQKQLCRELIFSDSFLILIFKSPAVCARAYHWLGRLEF